MHLQEELAITVKENLDGTPRVIPGKLLQECTMILLKEVPTEYPEEFPVQLLVELLEEFPMALLE